MRLRVAEVRSGIVAHRGKVSYLRVWEDLDMTDRLLFQLFDPRGSEAETRAAAERQAAAEGERAARWLCCGEAARRCASFPIWDWFHKNFDLTF